MAVLLFLYAVMITSNDSEGERNIRESVSDTMTALSAGLAPSTGEGRLTGTDREKSLSR
jgi:hypothetical protein